MKRKILCPACNRNTNALVHNLCVKCYRQANKEDLILITKLNRCTHEKIITDVFGEKNLLNARKKKCAEVIAYNRLHRDKVRLWDRNKKRKRYHKMNWADKQKLLRRQRARNRKRDPDRVRRMGILSKGRAKALNVFSLKWDDDKFWNIDKKPAKSKVKFKYFEFH